MRYLCLDTETTGLDPQAGHRVIELACVEIVNRQLTNRHFHEYFNADRDSDPEALRVHGLTTEFLSDKPRFANRVDDFLKFIEGATLVIHNAAFDVGFLNMELALVGLNTIDHYCAGIEDSLKLAQALNPGKRNNLDALCSRYEISNAHRVLHGALLDSELLADVWLAMTRGQESLLGDSDSESAAHHLSFDSSRLNHGALPLFNPSDTDQTEHQAYLNSLDKAAKSPCIWRHWSPVNPE